MNDFANDSGYDLFDSIMVAGPTQLGNRSSALHINYADDPDTDVIDVVSPYHKRDAGYWTYGRPDRVDPDSTGEYTERYGKDNGLGYTRDDVVAVNLYGGRTVSEKRLRQLGPEGVELLDAVRNARKNGRYDASEAVRETSWKDFIPFVTFLGKTVHSIKRAAQVNKIYDKIAKGDAVTDRELALVTLHEFTESRKAQGTFWSKVYNVAKDAIPMMGEFLLTGGAMSLARTAAGRGAIALGSTRLASSLAIPTIEHQFAKEAALELTGKFLAKRTAEKAAPAVAVDLLKTQGRKQMVDALTTEMTRRIGTRVGTTGSLLLDQQIANNIASRAIDGAIAARGRSNLFTKFVAGTMDWTKDHVTRGILDHGSWGCEAKSLFFSDYTSAGKALSDAIGQLFVEAPLKGTLMWAANKQLIRPVIEELVKAEDFEGNRIRLVGNTELSAKGEALRGNDLKKYELAEHISNGMEWLEYVSESTGSGFTSFFNFAGLATKLRAPGQRILVGEIGATGANALKLDKGALAGGWLRRLLRKKVGMADDFGTMSTRTKVRSIASALESQGVKNVPENAIEAMVRDKVVPASIARAFGTDNLNAIVRQAVRSEAPKLLDNEIYRSYTRFVFADFMFRHGWGVDETMNFFKHLGYDGVFNEMMEERYSEFASGLLGFDAFHNDTFKTRLLQGIKNLTDNTWEDLAVEACAFAVPGITRNLALIAQSSLGSDADIHRARMFGLDLRRAKDGMNILEETVGEYTAGMDSAREAMEADRARVQAELDTKREALKKIGRADDAAEAEVEALKEKVAEIDDQIAAHNKHRDDTLKANGIDPAVDLAAADIASRLVRFAVAPSANGKSTVAERLRVTPTAKDVNIAYIAANSVVRNAAWYGEAAFDASGMWMADSPNQEVKSFWKRAASKVIGISAAFMTMDPSLAVSNAVDWASVDESSDPVTTAALRNMFKRHRDDTIDKLTPQERRTMSEADIRAKFRDAYTEEAERYVNSQLLLGGMRMFARTDMRSIATRKIAADAGYDWNPATGEFEHTKDNGQPESVKTEDLMKTATVDSNGQPTTIEEAVEDMVSRIAISTTRMLTDPETFQAAMGPDGTGDGVIKYLNLRANDPHADRVAQALAMQMSSFQSPDIHATLELTRGVPIDQLLAEGNVRIQRSVVDAICKEYEDNGRDVTKVSDKLTESVLRQVHGEASLMRNDATLVDRKKAAIDLCMMAKYANDMGIERAFNVPVHIDTREYDQPRVTHVFRKDNNGNWRIKGFRHGATNGANTLYTATFTDAELTPANLAKFFGGVEPVEVDTDYVITPMKYLSSRDGFLFIQQLGEGNRYRNACLVKRSDGSYDESAVHPALRRKSDGTPLLSDKPGEDGKPSELARTLAEETAMARFYEAHKTDKAAFLENPNDNLNDPAVNDAVMKRMEAYKRMYDNVLGENHGYLWKMDNILRSRQVLTPTQSSGTNLVAPGSRDKYILPLTVYRGFSSSASTFIPVDYVRNMDGMSGFANAIIGRAIVANFQAFRKDGGVFHEAVKDFIENVRLNAILAIADEKTTPQMRQRLRKMIDSLTVNSDRPLVSSITQLATAYVLGQLDRAAVSRHSVTQHDAALLYIRKDVLSDQSSFLRFSAAIDVILGGSGLSTQLAASKAGASVDKLGNDTGILKLMSLLNSDEPVSKKVSETFESIVPMTRDGRKTSWEEMADGMGTYLNHIGRPKPMGKVAETAKGAHPLVKLRAILDASGVGENADEVVKFLRTQLSPAIQDRNARTTVNYVIGKLEAALKNTRDRLIQMDNEIKELRQKIAEKSQKKADPTEIANDEKTLNEMVGKRDSLAEGQAMVDDALRLEREIKTKRDVAVRDAAKRATEKAGDALDAPSPFGPTVVETPTGAPAETPAINPAVAPKTDDNGNVDAVDLMIDASDLFTDDTPDVSLAYTTDLTGVKVVPDVYRGTGFDHRGLKYAATIVDMASRAMALARDPKLAGFTATSKLTWDQFSHVVDRLTVNIAPPSVKYDMWRYYDGLVRAKGGIAELLESPSYDAVESDDEGQGSKDTTEYHRSTVAMYDNNVLASFLQFAELIAPGTGRELQGLLNAVRDNIARRRTALERTGATGQVAESVRFAHNLFNPRAVNIKGLNNFVDVDAWYNTEVLSKLDDDKFVDQLAADLLSEDKGEPASRVGAFFVLYLRALAPGARRHFMELVGNSVQTKRVSVENVDRQLLMQPASGRRGGVSEFAAVSSFGRLITEASPLKVQEMRDAIMNAARKAVFEKKFRSLAEGDRLDKDDEYSNAWNEYSETLAEILGPVLGYESPFVQALVSTSLKAALLDRGRSSFDLEGTRRALDTGICVPPAAKDRNFSELKEVQLFDLPDAVRDILDVFEKYKTQLENAKPEQLEDETWRRQTVSEIVSTMVHSGLRVDSERSKHKTLEATTYWSYVLYAYSASLPETIARATTIPERSTKPGANVSIAAPGLPPVVQQFVDRPPKSYGPDGDRTSFAYLAYRVWEKNESVGGKTDAFKRLTEERRRNNDFSPVTDADLQQYFQDYVLPMCKQRMVWPDARQRPVLGTNTARDYTADEVLQSCERYFTTQVQPNITKNPLATSKALLYVPIYAGEHPSAVIMQIPLETLCGDGLLFSSVEALGEVTHYTDASANDKANHELFETIARSVYDTLQLDRFGRDAKRSAMSTCRVTGHSYYGLRIVTDSKGNQHVQKGEDRNHLFHNFSLDTIDGAGKITAFNNDALLGTQIGFGYGYELQRSMSSNPDSDILKLHSLSSGDNMPTMGKGLAVVGRRNSEKTTGMFIKGTVERAIFDHFMKLRKEGDALDDLSSDTAYDDDSLKVGILNSKAAGIPAKTVDGKVTEVLPLKDYIFRKLYEGGHVKQGMNLNEKSLAPILDDGTGDGKFAFFDGRETIRTTIEELLCREPKLTDEEEQTDNGILLRRADHIRVTIVEGLGSSDRPMIDFSYVDNSLTSHRVANVSHKAEAHPSKMPRNNAVDALVMATVLKRAGLISDTNVSVNTMLSVLSGWDILTASAALDEKTKRFLRDTSDRVRMMQEENALGADSEPVVNQLARDLFSMMSETRNPIMNMVSSPLVSSGAYIGKDGAIHDHCTDPFLKYIHRGGSRFSEAEAKQRYNGASHRCGLVQLNCRSAGIRHMMFLSKTADLKAALAQFKNTDSREILRLEGENATLVAHNGLGGADPGDSVIEQLEALFNMVHAADLDYARYFRRAEDAHLAGEINDDEYDNRKARAKAKRAVARRAREIVMNLFVDHHGVSMSKRRRLWGRDGGEGSLINEMGFDDLFVEQDDGTIRFDRTAVLEDVPLPSELNSSGKETGVALAGTMVGLPRTPSYNGSMWLANARVSIPATEVMTEAGWMPGEDAMVMPDVQTLAILGCDHDGDKTTCYMYDVDPRTGVSYFLDAAEELLPTDVKGLLGSARNAGELTAPEQWASDHEKRRQYLTKMLKLGYVSCDEPRTVVDENTGKYRFSPSGFEVTNKAKILAGNSIVRGLFALSRAREMKFVDTVPVKFSDADDGKEWLETQGLLNSGAYADGRFTRPTKARPLPEDAWKSLLTIANATPFNFLSKGTIGDPYVAALVSTSGQSADTSRGYVVSFARRLHLAMLSGLFDQGSQLGELFAWDNPGADGKEHMRKWLDFIYGVDGISNATFDDIKEQICMKMGWTPGMIESLFASLMFYVDENGHRLEPPTTAEDMGKILSEYVSSIKDHGARFHMMVASMRGDMTVDLYSDKNGTVRPEGLRKEYRTLFSGRFYKPDLYKAFSIGVDAQGRAIPVTVGADSGAIPDLAKFAVAFAAKARSYAENKFYGNTAAQADYVSTALRDLIDAVARGKGENAAVGYVYYILRGANGKTGSLANEATMDSFMNWFNGTRALRKAKEVTDSFNCFNANPSDAVLMGSRAKMAKTFNDAMSQAKGKDAEASAPWITAMFLGNMISYNAGDTITTQGRATLASTDRDEQLLKLGADARNLHEHNLIAVTTALAIEATVPSNRTLLLEGNAQTIPYVLAALRTMPELDAALKEGTDLFSGDGGLAAWGTMETIARAASFVPEGLFSYIDTPGNKTVGETSIPLDGDPRSTVGFLNGVCAMLNVLHTLISTSNESTQYSGLTAFSIQKERALSGQKESWFQSASTSSRKDSMAYAEARRITCYYHDKNPYSRAETHRKLAKLVELNNKERTSGYNNVHHSLGVEHGKENGKVVDLPTAKSFALTVENLQNLLVELGEVRITNIGTPSETRTRVVHAGNEQNGREPAQLQLVKDIDTCIRILKALEKDHNGNEPVTITASGFLKQILPLYSVMTTRSEPPGPRSLSILSMLPGVYERLSREQARMASGELERKYHLDDSPGHCLIDLLSATNFALIRGRRATGAQGEQLGRVGYGDMPNASQAMILGKLADAYIDRRNPKSLKQAIGDKMFATLISPFAPDGEPVRGNPESSHYVDLLGGQQLLRKYHELLNEAFSVSPLLDDRVKDEPVADVGDFSAKQPEKEDVKLAVGWLQTALKAFGARAEVVYTGGDTALVRFKNGLQGSGALMFAGNTRGADMTIRIQFGVTEQEAASEYDPFALDVNSPNVAVSFCQATGNRLTPEQFMALTFGERKNLVDAATRGGLIAGAAGYSLAMPSWSLDSNKLLTLAGAIRIKDPKNRKALFHEYFHSMFGAFRTLGIFNNEDLEVLRQRFPLSDNHNRARMLFDEERAADEFAAFIDREVFKSVGDVVDDADTKEFHELWKSFLNQNDTVLERLWQKIKDAIHLMLQMFKYGFHYRDVTPEHLFRFVMSGYAPRSIDSLNEIPIDPNFAPKAKGFGDVEFDGYKVEHLASLQAQGVINSHAKDALDLAIQLRNSYVTGEDYLESPIEGDRETIRKTRAGSAGQARLMADDRINRRAKYADPAMPFAKRLAAAYNQRNDHKNGKAGPLSNEQKLHITQHEALLNELKKPAPNFKAVVKLVQDITTLRATRLDADDNSGELSESLAYQIAQGNDFKTEGAAEVTRVDEYVSEPTGKRWTRHSLALLTSSDELMAALQDDTAPDATIGSALVKAYPETLDAAAHLAPLLGKTRDELLTNPDMLAWRIAHQEVIKRKAPIAVDDDWLEPGSPNVALSSSAAKRLVRSTRFGHSDEQLMSLFTNHKSIIVFDTETTGLYSHRNKLTQLTAIKLQLVNGVAKEVGRVNYYVALDGHVPDPGALETSHLDPAKLVAGTEIDGTPVLTEKEVITKFNDFVGSDTTLFVAHNAKFDSAVMLSAFSRHGFNGSNVITRADWLDTETVFRDRAAYDTSIMQGHLSDDIQVGYRADGKGKFQKTTKWRDGTTHGLKYMRGHKQEAMALHYGIPLDSNAAHRSDYDAEVLVKCLKALSGERDDLADYINIFGYRAKYGVRTSLDAQDDSAVDRSEWTGYGRMAGVLYIPQWHPTVCDEIDPRTGNVISHRIVDGADTLPAIVRRATGTEAFVTQATTAAGDSFRTRGPRVKVLEQENKYQFKPTDPAISPEAELAVNEALAQIDNAVLFDPVDEDLRPEIYDGSYRLVNAAARAVYHLMTEDDREILDGKNLKNTVEARLREAITMHDTGAKLLEGKLPERLRAKLAMAEEGIFGGAALLQRLAGGAGATHNGKAVNFRTWQLINVMSKLWDDDFFRQSADRALPRKDKRIGQKRAGLDHANFFAKMYTSKNDIAAAVLAATGVKFGTLLDNALAQLEELGKPFQGRGITTADTETLNYLHAQLSVLTVKADVTKILADPSEWSAALDEFCRNVFSGIERGDFNGRTLDYGVFAPVGTFSEDSTSLAAMNMRRYNLPHRDDAAGQADPGVKFRQRALQLVADAVFTTAAQVKFCREAAMQPGKLLNSNWVVREADSAAQLAQLTGWHGISAEHMTADDPLVEATCQPFYIAANLDEVMESSIRVALGNKPLRDMMMSRHAVLRGHMSDVTRLVNNLDDLTGISHVAGAKLAKLIWYKQTHKFNEGSIEAYSDEEYRKMEADVWGFNNFNGFISGETVDVSLTELEWQTQVLLSNFGRVLLQGGTKLITGIDGVRFTKKMFYVDNADGSQRRLQRSDLDWHKLNTRMNAFTGKEGGRALNRLEMSLWKLGLNWNEFVTGIAKPGEQAPKVSMRMYDRVVDTILRSAEEVMSDPNMKPDKFNDHILTSLEHEGLLVGSAHLDRKTGAATLLEEGVLCLDVEAFREAYVKSSGYDKLVNKAGRSAEMMDPKFIAEQLGAKIKLIWKELRNQPWLNTADMAYLNDFRSLVPAFVGTGSFTAGLHKAEAEYLRDLSATQVETIITRHEATFAKMLANKDLADRTYESLTDTQIDMIHDNFQTRETGAELRRAFREGKYREGTEASRLTGLVIDNGGISGKPTNFVGICQQMYASLCEKYLSILEGRFGGDEQTMLAIGRMLREYEAAASESTGAAINAMGLTDVQVYKRHRSLPANMTAGHAVITMLRGLQNSLYFQSTLVNMLLTPAEDGTPLYFADPGEVGPEAQVVPDEVWGMLAKWWERECGLKGTSLKGVGLEYEYDITRTGMENARMAYKAVAAAWQRGGSKLGTLPFVEMSQADLNNGTVSHMLVRVNTKDSTIVDKLMTANSAGEALALRGGEALGYAKHLFNTQRSYAPGFVMKSLQHIMAWSKTMSVACSMFFSIATQWESATAATGFMATLYSNGIPGFRGNGKRSPKSAKKSKTLTGLARMTQKLFTLGTKEGWINENFIGFQDIVRMMDTNDPFLSDLIMWAESIGITMSDSLKNPMEENKPIVMKDLERLTKLIKPLYKSRSAQLAAQQAIYEGVLGKDEAKRLAKEMNVNATARDKGREKIADAMNGVFNALIARRGEKAFTYALNATKLAVAAQVAMRLKTESVAKGHAFDPIRDMRGYAEYVDSEVGGVNPLRYAWAHPGTTRFLNILFFSWQWTRTAWEAGGGGILEDMFLGGHSTSKQQRGVTLARWARMFLAIQIAFPMLLQLTSKALGKMFGYDDDRDKWWIFQNEAGRTMSANIRPLLMIPTKFDRTLSDGLGLEYEQEGKVEYGWLGSKKVTGAHVPVLGHLPLVNRVANAALGLIPEYTGADSQRGSGYRAMYVHIGKQGAEFPRWFTDFRGQFLSKLSLPVQGVLDSALGVSLSALGRPGRTPGSEFVPFSRRINPFEVNDSTGLIDFNHDSIAWNVLVRPFSPFSLNTIGSKPDSGFIGSMMPVQYGSSETVFKDLLQARLRKTVTNDRDRFHQAITGGIKDNWLIHPSVHSEYMRNLYEDIRRDAEANGIDGELFQKNILSAAVKDLRSEIYEELFAALPETAADSYSIDAINRKVRQIVKLGGTLSDIADSVNSKLKKRGRYEVSERYFNLLNAILQGSYADPVGFSRSKLDEVLKPKHDDKGTDSGQ